MSALPSYYSSPTTTDPFPGLTKFTQALSDAGNSLLLGLLFLVIAGACIAIWRNIQPETPGMVALGAVIAVSGFFGLKKIGDSYSIMDAATGGTLGKLFSAAFALLPVLIVLGMIWLLGKWLDGRI